MDEAAVDPGPHLVPADFAVLGPRDASVVLLLRILRRSAWVVIPMGATVAVLAGISPDGWVLDPTDPTAWWRSLVSPLWLLTVGVAMRIVLAPLAYSVAVVVAVAGTRDVHGSGPEERRLWARWTDRFRTAGALRALRWTVAVRDHAVATGGASARVLRVAERVVGLLVVVAWTALAVVSAVGASG